MTLGLIETNEFLRISNRQNLSFESSEVNSVVVKQYSSHDESLEYYNIVATTTLYKNYQLAIPKAIHNQFQDLSVKLY